MSRKLANRFAEAVARLNPDLAQSAVDDLVHVVANPDHPSLERNNRVLHRLCTSGAKAKYSTDDGKEAIFAQILWRLQIVFMAGRSPV